MTPEIQARWRTELLEATHFEPNTGCWLWGGPVYNEDHRHTYGKFGPSSAHRASYQAFVGPIPGGLFVLHRCDTPLCINPAHLYLGTQLTNMQDATARGRFKRSRQARRRKNPLFGKIAAYARLHNLPYHKARASIKAGIVSHADLCQLRTKWDLTADPSPSHNGAHDVS